MIVGQTVYVSQANGIVGGPVEPRVVGQILEKKILYDKPDQYGYEGAKLDGVFETEMAAQMDQILKRIKSIVEDDFRTGGSVDDLFRSATEELGEIATAYSIETGYKTRQLEESSKSESLDLTICAMALYFALGGKVEKFAKIINKKLDKWEASQKLDKWEATENETHPNR